MTQQVTHLPGAPSHQAAAPDNTPALEAGLALYVHWPWCAKKCPYCDFNSHTTNTPPESEYIGALVTELAQTAACLQNKDGTPPEVVSVFFGGGTPSLMQPTSVARVLHAINQHFNLPQHVEITLEANPTSTEGQKLKDFAAAGVNRFSVGVQSLNKEDLAFLGREHSASEALKAVDMALAASDNVNLDLIYGLPHQTVDSWTEQLDTALMLGTSHISCYQLTIEKNTMFWGRFKRGELTMPDEDTQADFFDATNAFMAANGMEGYEVSNYARPGMSCRHNRHIWRYGDYMGLGAGAHGRIRLRGVGPVATRNLKMPQSYMEAVPGETQRVEEQPLTPTHQAVEALLMGLRLREGIPLRRLEALAHKPWEDVLDMRGLELMKTTGFVTLRNHRDKGLSLQATDQGWPVLDGVLQHLIPDHDGDNDKMYVSEHLQSA